MVSQKQRAGGGSSSLRRKARWMAQEPRFIIAGGLIFLALFFVMRIA